MEDNQPARELRLLAKRRSEYYDKHYDLACDQLTSVSKWLTGSLLAINGAALISIASNVTSFEESKFVAIPFIGGLFCALLSAVLIQWLYDGRSEPLSDFADYWCTVEETAVRNIDEENRLVLIIKKWNDRTWLAPAAGWLSGILFFIGAAMFALQLKS